MPKIFSPKLSAALTVPPTVIASFIPASTLSVFSFVTATVLPDVWTADFHAAQPVFSENEPVCEVRSLLSIPLPTENDITKLRREVCDAWSAGARSLQGLDPGSMDDIPLWFITWADMMIRIVRQRNRWSMVRTVLMSHILALLIGGHAGI
jgi:hypothetical protein